MRPEPYVGITGVTTRDEAARVCASAHPADPMIMVGMLISSKTLVGIRNRWPMRYPTPSVIPTVFGDEKNALNLIHFNTDAPALLCDDMIAAHTLAGPHCHGFQLNIAWPEPRMLEKYRASDLFEKKCIVLQCGKTALAAVRRCPTALARRLLAYKDLVDYALIDPSEGLGIEFDASFGYTFFEALHRHGPETIGYGIAGGLHAGNVRERVGPLLGYFDISVDAEGRLRDREDRLDLPATIAYKDATMELHREKAVRKAHYLSLTAPTKDWTL